MVTWACVMVIAGVSCSEPTTTGTRVWRLPSATMASVTFSGAGPPLPILYLMPKSPSGPPGLWLADRISPPITTIASA